MASIARSCYLRAAAAARIPPVSCPIPWAPQHPVSRLLRPHPGRHTQRLFSASRQLLERKYTRDHEWIDVSADSKTGTIGISEYAAEALGDVVYVELPDPDAGWLSQGDVVGAVESVKSASDINAPLRLRVTHVNSLLEEKPGTVNQVPEDESAGGGWIAKVELDETSLEGLPNLMTATQYKAFTKEENN